MRWLDPVLQIAPDECTTSYVSRLARANFEPSSRSFCRCIGIPFQRLVDGCAEAFNALAGLTDIPASQLARNAIRKETSGFSLHGETLRKTTFRRGQVVVCPECLKGDIASSTLPPEQAAYGRIIWRIAAINTCPIHHIGLVEVTKANTGSIHDFTSIVSPRLPDLSALAQSALRRPPTGLESYLAARLTGAPREPEWFDKMDLVATIKTCEMFGAAAIFDRKHNLKALTPDQWRACAGVGYAAVRTGEAGIREFATKMHDAYRSRLRINEGPHARFGKLHEWMASVSEQPNFRELRDILRRRIIELMPIGPPKVLFGTVIEERCLHSIRTAGLEIGMHPMGLRKALEAFAIIGPETKRLADHRVLFDAQKAAPALAKLRGAISLKEAESYLNAGRVHTKLLLTHGFIESVFGKAAVALKAIFFSPAELDQFMERLLTDARPIARAQKGMAGLAGAAKRANCSAMEIVQLLLNRKLDTVRRLVGQAGYASVLVRVDEVKAYVRRPAPDGLTLERVMAELGTFHAVVRALVDNGKLPTHRAINPVNHAPMWLVARTDLDAFKQKYVRLAELARRRRQHPRSVRLALERRGIRPALELDKATYKILFYRRADIAS